MRCVHNPQCCLGQTPIPDIQIAPRNRDDIPAVLKGLQHLYCDERRREQVFELLERHLLRPPHGDADASERNAPRINAAVGRPRLDPWQVLVLALLKQGLNCDFDRLAELANKHLDVRRMLGVAEQFGEQRFAHRAVVRNVGLLSPQLLAEVNQIVVQAGLALAEPAAVGPWQARIDSFFVETNVRFPTDVRLQWDALRCLLRVLGVVCEQYGVPDPQSPQRCYKAAKRITLIRFPNQINPGESDSKPSYSSGIK